MKRRTALKRLSAIALAPAVLSACSKAGVQSTASASKAATNTALPASRPADWDAVKFNLARGAAGAIPASYMVKIKAADGIAKHLGKHLPYVVKADGVGAGELGLMWGDASKGYAQHPNAGKSEKNPTGHWYNWVKVRNSRTGAVMETRFDNWPKCSAAVNGRLLASQGGDVSANGGRYTIYVTKLPAGTKAGDELRIHAHCLTHGEYVDFVTA